MVDRYGVRTPMGSPIFSDKIKNTMVRLYGVPYALQSPEIIQRKILTSIKMYGTKTPSESQHIKDKISTSLANHYNTRCIEMGAYVGFVYVINFPSLGAIKIGVSSDVTRRLNELKRGCKCDADILEIIESTDCYRVEQHMHNMFNEFRICLGEEFSGHTEFFSMTTEYYTSKRTGIVFD